MATHTKPSVRLATLGLGRSSVDLALVVISLAATALVVSLDGPAIVRVPFALSLVFFVPGYALTVALFPAGESSLTNRLGGSVQAEGITLLDRLVVSVGLSLCTVVLAGLAIDALPPALSAESVLGALVAVSVLAVSVAVYRRRAVPSTIRYTPFEPSAGDSGSETSSRTLTIVRLVLAASVLFAGVALITSAGATNDEGGITEFYFVTESGAEDPATGGYPINLTASEEREVAVAVGNEEGQGIDYTVVGQLQRVDRTNGSLAVRDRRRVVGERVTVENGETRTLNSTVSPPQVGEYRLVYLLYEGDVPDDPRLSNADEEIHLWIDAGQSAAAVEP